MTNKESRFDGPVAEPFRLDTLLEYQSSAIVSRTLIDAGDTTMTVFALEEGQRISEHSAPHDALVQVIDGTGCVEIDGEPYALDTGESIVFPANVPHAVEAEESFKMLLTMVR